MKLRDHDKRPDYESMIPFDKIMSFLENKYPNKCFRVSGECPYREAYEALTNDNRVNVTISTEDPNDPITISDLENIKVIEEDTGKEISLIDIIASDNEDSFNFIYRKTKEEENITSILTDPVSVYAKSLDKLHMAVPTDFKYYLSEETHIDEGTNNLVHSTNIVLQEYIGTEHSIYIPSVFNIKGILYHTLFDFDREGFVNHKNSFFNSTRLMIQDVVISDTIDTLTDATSMFANCPFLVYVKLPSSVLNLNYGFKNCYNLKCIEITCPTSGIDMISGCCKLTDVSNVVLSYDRFRDCTNLISSNAESIEKPFSFDTEYTGHVNLKNWFTQFPNVKTIYLPKTDCIVSYENLYAQHAISGQVSYVTHDYVYGYIDKTCKNLNKFLYNDNCKADLTILLESLDGVSTTDFMKIDNTTEVRDGFVKVLQGHNDASNIVAKSLAILGRTNGANVFYANPISDFVYTLDKKTGSIIIRGISPEISTDESIYIRSSYKIKDTVYTTYIYSGEKCDLEEYTIVTDSDIKILSKTAWENTDGLYTCTVDIKDLNNIPGEDNTEITKLNIRDNNGAILTFQPLQYPTKTSYNFTTGNWSLVNESYICKFDLGDYNDIAYTLKYNGDYDHEYLFHSIDNYYIEDGKFCITTIDQELIETNIDIQLLFDVGRSADIRDVVIDKTKWQQNPFTNVWYNTVPLINFNQFSEYTISSTDSNVKNALYIYDSSENYVTFAIGVSASSDTIAYIKSHDISMNLSEKYTDVGYIVSIRYANKQLTVYSLRNPNVNLSVDYDLKCKRATEVPDGAIRPVTGLFIYPGLFSCNTTIKHVWIEPSTKYYNNSIAYLFLKCTNINMVFNIINTITNFDYAFYECGNITIYANFGNIQSYEKVIGTNIPKIIVSRADTNFTEFNTSIGNICDTTFINNFSYSFKNGENGFTYIVLLKYYGSARNVHFPSYYFINNTICYIMLASAYSNKTKDVIDGKSSDVATGVFTNNDTIVRITTDYVKFENDDMSFQFAGCSHLEQIVINTTNNIKNMVYAFYKSALRDISVSYQYSLKSIKGIISMDKNLTSVPSWLSSYIPNSIINMDEAFYITYDDVNKVTPFTLPKLPVSVETIKNLSSASILLTISNKPDAPLYGIRNVESAIGNLDETSQVYLPFGKRINYRAAILEEPVNKSVALTSDYSIISRDVQQNTRSTCSMFIEKMGLRKGTDYTVETVTDSFSSFDMYVCPYVLSSTKIDITLTQVFTEHTDGLCYSIGDIENIRYNPSSGNFTFTSTDSAKAGYICSSVKIHIKFTDSAYINNPDFAGMTGYTTGIIEIDGTILYSDIEDSVLTTETFKIPITDSGMVEGTDYVISNIVENGETINIYKIPYMSNELVKLAFSTNSDIVESTGKTAKEFANIQNVTFNERTGIILFNADLNFVDNSENTNINSTVSFIFNPDEYKVVQNGKVTFSPNMSNIPVALIGSSEENTTLVTEKGYEDNYWDWMDESPIDDKIAGTIYDTSEYITADAKTVTATISETGELDVINDQNMNQYFDENGNVKVWKCPMEYCPSHIYNIYYAYWYACYYNNTSARLAIETAIKGYIETNFVLLDPETNKVLNIDSMSFKDLLNGINIKTIQKNTDKEFVFRTTEQNVNLINDAIKDKKYDLKLYL